MGENVILQGMAGASHTQFPHTHHKRLRANFTAQKPIKKVIRIKKKKQNTQTKCKNSSFYHLNNSIQNVCIYVITAQGGRKKAKHKNNAI
jgi:hypothetical protein